MSPPGSLPSSSMPPGARPALRNATRGTLVARDVEVARSLWARFRGLMLRPPPPEGSALWLPGTNGVHTHFVRFPLDLVFVGRDLRVLRVIRRLRPWRFSPIVRGAAAVLELRGGALAASGTEPGDQLEWSWEPSERARAACIDSPQGR